MAQQFKLPTAVADDDRDSHFTRITEGISSRQRLDFSRRWRWWLDCV
jgi:hypothetical protein